MFFSSVNQTAHCDQLESAGATGDYDEDVAAYSCIQPLSDNTLVLLQCKIFLDYALNG